MRKVLHLIALATLLVPAATARLGFPDALTERGRIVEELYYPITIIAIAVFVLVCAILGYILWKYREGTGNGKATYEKERHNLKAEILWTVIPLIVVLWVGVVSYIGMMELDVTGQPEPQMEVQITGSQWNWQAAYGDGVSVYANPDAKTGAVKVENEFLVPANVPILFNITSSDVIHAFGIFDANGAYFGMNDANPLGSNKYAYEVFTFPAGTYYVQCKEMCLNPGHAYMRATIKSVPMGEYNAWLEEKALAVGASLVSKIQVRADGSTLATEAGLTYVSSTRLILEVTNTGTAAVTIVSGARTLELAPGTTGLTAMDLPAEGTYKLTATNGGSLSFTAVDAEIVTVDLGAFKLEPESLNLVAGKTYLIQSTNNHSTSHNLFVGTYGGAVLAQSGTVGGGETTSLVWTPEAGTYDMWCDIPGHHGLGMFGTVTVS